MKWPCHQIFKFQAGHFQEISSNLVCCSGEDLSQNSHDLPIFSISWHFLLVLRVLKVSWFVSFQPGGRKGPWLSGTVIGPCIYLPDKCYYVMTPESGFSSMSPVGLVSRISGCDLRYSGTQACTQYGPVYILEYLPCLYYIYLSGVRKTSVNLTPQTFMHIIHRFDNSGSAYNMHQCLRYFWNTFSHHSPFERNRCYPNLANGTIV